MTEPTEPWLTKKPWEVRNARLIQRERYTYIAFGIAVVLMTMAAMFLFAGCVTPRYLQGVCTVEMKLKGKC